jgi:hypothetical protein
VLRDPFAAALSANALSISVTPNSQERVELASGHDRLHNVLPAEASASAARIASDSPRSVRGESPDNAAGLAGFTDQGGLRLPIPAGLN